MIPEKKKKLTRELKAEWLKTEYVLFAKDKRKAVLRLLKQRDPFALLPLIILRLSLQWFVGASDTEAAKRKQRNGDGYLSLLERRWQKVN